jgi:hypothetical protein
MRNHGSRQANVSLSSADQFDGVPERFAIVMDVGQNGYFIAVSRTDREEIVTSRSLTRYVG